VKRPAILDGPPAFGDGLPFARPFVPPLEAVMARLAPSYETGMLTNGRLVKTLEAQVAARLQVPHVVAVSSCTAGLMLAVQALCPEGPVVLPSFTFSASAHSVAWNGRRPRFVECDAHTFHIDLDDAERQVPGASGILATHVFGAPCRASELEKVAEANAVPLLFDAAHALGASHGGRPVGSFGDAEIFSLSPTKLVVAGEGGLVATRRADVAERLRIGRDYGNPGDYDTRFVGLNARMSEFHAAMALESFDLLDEQLALRSGAAARYCDGLAPLPGIDVQEIPGADSSTYKDFCVIVDPARFGLTRDVLVAGLAAEGIDTRNYFDPPIHRQQAYANLPESVLPVTDDVSARVTSLPMFAALPPDAVDRVVECMFALHELAEEVAASPGATRAVRSGRA